MAKDQNGSIHKRTFSRKPIPLAFRQQPFFDAIRPSQPVLLEEFFPSTDTYDENEEDEEEEESSSRFSTPSPTPSEANFALKGSLSSLYFPPTAPTKAPRLDCASSKFGARRQLFDRFRRPRLPSPFHQARLPTSVSDQSALCDRLKSDDMLGQPQPQRHSSKSMDLPRSMVGETSSSSSASSSSSSSSAASSAASSRASLASLRRHHKSAIQKEKTVDNGQVRGMVGYPQESHSFQPSLASTAADVPAIAFSSWTSPTKQQHKGRSNSEQISPSKEVRSKLGFHAPLRHGGSASAAMAPSFSLEGTSSSSSPYVGNHHVTRLPSASLATHSSRGKRIERRETNGQGKTSMDDDVFKSHLDAVETSFDDQELRSLAHASTASSDSLVLDLFNTSASGFNGGLGLGGGFPAPPSFSTRDAMTTQLWPQQQQQQQQQQKKKTLREIRSTGNLRSGASFYPQALNGWRQGQQDENLDVFGAGAQPRRFGGTDGFKVAVVSPLLPVPTRSPLRERRAKPPLSLRATHCNVLMANSRSARQGLKSPGGSIHSPPPCPPPTTPLPDLPPTPATGMSSLVSSMPLRKGSICSVRLPERLRSASIGSSGEASQFQPLIFRHEQPTVATVPDDEEEEEDNDDEDDEAFRGLDCLADVKENLLDDDAEFEIDPEPEVDYGNDSFEEAYGSSVGGYDGNHTSAESSFSSPTSISSPFTPLDCVALPESNSNGSNKHQQLHQQQQSQPFQFQHHIQQKRRANSTSFHASGSLVAALSLDWNVPFTSTVNGTSNALGLQGVPPPPFYSVEGEEEGEIVYGFAM